MEANTAALSNEELAKYDYVIMIDKSGSMSTKDCPGGKERWAYAQEQTEAIARKAAEFDNDGIDVTLFAGTQKYFSGVTPEKVAQIFAESSPSGSTNTAAALAEVFARFNERKATGTFKPLIVVCITDGAPDDQKAVDQVIINQANSQTTDAELGITFVQIGKDPAARAFLKHLDDDLQGLGAKYDIVDTKNEEEMENISITELLVEAVTD